MQLFALAAVNHDMTTNRARAYGRVMTLIEELGPAKLHADVSFPITVEVTAS